RLEQGQGVLAAAEMVRRFQNQLAGPVGPAHRVPFQETICAHLAERARRGALWHLEMLGDIADGDIATQTHDQPQYLHRVGKCAHRKPPVCVRPSIAIPATHDNYLTRRSPLATLSATI